jgi:enolase
MDRRIASVQALEILDSQGNPTVRAFVTLDGGSRVSASVPAGGGSAGPKEASELRDGDAHRYGGLGVVRAISLIEGEIAPKLIGLDPTCQSEIDRLLIDLDGTPNKSRLGANAILAVSMAVARAGAAAIGLPLYTYLGGPGANRLPLPMMNVLNGGAHADNSVDLEEFMVVPIGAPTFAEAMRYGAETYHALRRLLRDRYHRTVVGDEGGFAPNLMGNEKACDLIVEAIKAAGYRPGDDIALAIDVAAGQLYQDGVYNFRWSAKWTANSKKTPDVMLGFLGSLIRNYPIISIEDGLAENDWSGFKSQMAFYGWKVQIVGDDLYATNPRLIAEGIAKGATNTVVIRLGQIGTVSEAIEAVQLCRDAGWGFVVADRAADTEDTFTADFAVAMGGGQIKCGSTCRGERVAKYNRLLEIEAELGPRAVYSHSIRCQPWQIAAAEQDLGSRSTFRVSTAASNGEPRQESVNLWSKMPAED